MTLIQRFGSALNLNVHFHMLFLDGVYVEDEHGLRFQRMKAPSHAELDALVHILRGRIARCLEKRGLLERDAGNSWLPLEEEGEEDTLSQFQGSSITYRIALNPDRGRKVFTLQTPPRQDRESGQRLSLCKIQDTVSDSPKGKRTTNPQ